MRMMPGEEPYTSLRSPPLIGVQTPTRTPWMFARLKVMNRTLLKKLRPGPLGRVKLAELLDELIVGFQRRHPGTEVQTSLGKLADS